MKTIKIYEMNEGSISRVASLMARIKPEFWDEDGAAEQLRTGTGWYLGENEETPIGWVLCQDQALYKTGEIECLGFESNGALVIDENLLPLIEAAENWAKKKGYANMRFTIGSRGLSCHLKELGEIPEELKNIKGIDREEYNWFLSMGYKPCGILPNVYGELYHGIMLIKLLKSRRIKMICSLGVDKTELPVKKESVVRPVKAEDQKILAEAMFEAYKGTVDQVEENVDEALVEVKNIMNDGYGLFLQEASFLIEKDGIAASVILINKFEGKPLITEIFTRKEFYKQGMAGALIKASRNALYRLGYEELALYVMRENVGAIRLYEKLGFKRVD